MAEGDGTVVIEGARLVFRNFAGRETMRNREGDRNFAVLLDPDVAELLTRDGWNVRTLAAREEGDTAQPILQVSVGYGKGRPPAVWMITSRGRTPLGENEVELLDYADIRHVDLIIRPYHWTVGANGGIKAYLKSIFVTVEEDALELKYADVPTVSMRAGKTDEG